MFSKKKATLPASVADAIAPFNTVRQNLVFVAEAMGKRMNLASKRIDDAKAYAAEVERTETAEAEAAKAELDQAQKIADALSAILGEPTQEQLRKEQASADA